MLHACLPRYAIAHFGKQCEVIPVYPFWCGLLHFSVTLNVIHCEVIRVLLIPLHFVRTVQFCVPLTVVFFVLALVLLLLRADCIRGYIRRICHPLSIVPQYVHAYRGYRENMSCHHWQWRLDAASRKGFSLDKNTFSLLILFRVFVVTNDTGIMCNALFRLCDLCDTVYQ